MVKGARSHRASHGLQPSPDGLRNTLGVCACPHPDGVEKPRQGIVTVRWRQG